MTRAVLLAAALLLCPSTIAAQSAAPAAPDPFERGSWHFQLASHAAFELWNYNGNHEEVYTFVPGVSYGVSDAVAAFVTFPAAYVNQRGVDGAFQGVTFGLRTRVYRRGRLSVFFDFDVGVSYADTYTPPRGTRFNYLALGTIGVIVPVRRDLFLMAGARLVHVSNNGLAGRERNPDIEALGPQIGILRRF